DSIAAQGHREPNVPSPHPPPANCKPQPTPPSAAAPHPRCASSVPLCQQPPLSCDPPLVRSREHWAAASKRQRQHFHPGNNGDGSDDGSDAFPRELPQPDEPHPPLPVMLAEFGAVRQRTTREQPVHESMPEASRSPAQSRKP